MNYIDSHVHVWTDEEGYPMDPAMVRSGTELRRFLPRQILAHARASGVTRIVLVQMSYYGTDNSYLLDVIAGSPTVFRGIAIIDPSSPDLGSQMSDLKSKGIRGFRIAIVDEASATSLRKGVFNPMFERAACEGMAVCPLINPEYLPLLPDVCKLFPEAVVLIDHLARIGMTGSIRQDDVNRLCELAQYPGVAVKISAFYALGARKAPHADLVGLIERVIDSFGVQRLMWGSDCPFQILEEPYESSLALIRDHMQLKPEDREWILRGTAERLFFPPNGRVSAF